jgi:putative peptide zinc metalloprotease protein
VAGVLGGLVALDVWLVAFHGIAQSLREVLYSPALLMMMLGLVILSAAFHECGHATACAYGGARPGVMGAGLYIIWPAFYTDVTDAYRLGKAGRLRTDLGGVYFNVVFMLATAGVYAVTGYEPLLLVIPFMHLEILHQFLPFIRLDGYYIVSDLTGVPDMFARIRPTLASILPWKQTSQRVTELKPWVRVVVTAYVFTVVPLLLFMFGMMVMNAPRVFGTAYDSFFTQYHKVQHAFDTGGTLDGSIGIFQIIILVLPAAGIVATFWMAFRRTAGALWVRTEGYPAVRMALLGASAGVAAAMAYVWWPGADYHPIQRGERGTWNDVRLHFHHLPRGRSTPTREPITTVPTRPTTEKLPTTTNQTTTTDTGTSTHPQQTGTPTFSGPTTAPGAPSTTEPTVTTGTTTTGTTMSGSTTTGSTTTGSTATGSTATGSTTTP